jgi:hypothetical protein
MRKTVVKAFQLLFGVVLALGLGFSAVSANTTGFSGDTVLADYLWPNLGTVEYPSGTAVVGAGVEFNNIGGFGVGISPTVDFSNTNILIDYAGGWTLNGSGTFDGWVFKDFSAVDIVSVSLNAATTLSGFTVGDLSFGSNYITANTLGLGPNFSPGTLISIDVGFAATPLPSTWTMLIAGFVGLGFFAYRGTKKNSTAISAV